MTVNEDLLDIYQTRGKAVYRVYEPEGISVVLGAGRNQEDVRVEETRADNIPVLKRRGGGGTVVLSPGQLVLALVTEVASPFNNLAYARTINSWFKESLEDFGVSKINDRGISDLAVDNRKILGTSLYRRRRTLFYQASLLVSNDLDLFERFLTYPSRVPDYRQGRGHVSFCTTLQREGYNIPMTALIESLEGVLIRCLPAFS